MIRRPGDLKPDDVAPFVRVSLDEFSRPFDFNDDLSHFKWVLATADSYQRIGLHLWQSQRPDLLVVYKEYHTALRYSPGYDASRQALIRLTGSATINAPATDAERQAAALAERASEATRRGDYQAAMKTLDEAERLAPKFVLVYQYRSNVAFLMGDRPAALAALRKALEIEPDNVLFKTNIERLEQRDVTPKIGQKERGAADARR